VVVTGNNGDEFYTAKYASGDGSLLWDKRYYGESGDSGGSAVAVDTNGNVVVTGSFEDDFYTAKYAAADGALVWEKRYNGRYRDSNDGAAAVAIDSSGNVVVTGYTERDDEGDDIDYYTAKYAAADGALLWEKRYNGPGNYRDYAWAVAVDGNGNVVVTGSSQDTFQLIPPAVYPSPDIYTAKYAALDGSLIWEKRYKSPAGGSGAMGVAVDGSNNVVVTGGSYNGTNGDFYTAKYAAVNGALLWERRYNGPANGQDSGRAVAVDRNGNVVVIGSSERDDGNSDYYTAKYAAADGALLWERRYNGPANRRDGAESVAIDPVGNVVVTGSSENETNVDYYTAKYAAGDGSLLWEKRYDTLTHGNDRTGFSHCLALGPHGMIAVTGFSQTSDMTESLTVVYREGLSIEIIPLGIRIRFTGVPGQIYNIERAPNVTGPWSTNATLTASTNGIVEYTDTDPPPGSAFYRTSAP
jgi:fibronectin-binding autotransporter adhesin